MNEKSPLWFIIVGFLMLGGLFLLLKQLDFDWSFGSQGRTVERETKIHANPAKVAKVETEQAVEIPQKGNWVLALAGKMLELAQQLAKRGAIQGEAVFQFKNAAEYEQFLRDAAAAGLKIKGKLPALNAARIGFANLDELQRFLANNPTGANAEMSANYYVEYPTLPDVAERLQSGAAPVGGPALALIGALNNTEWGKGLTIAVLDSGIAALPDFAGRLRSLQLADNPTTDLSHGTAVAGLAAGSHLGVTPLANLLSVGVVSADGLSDSFTLAQGIMAAVDHGAHVINISLGSYGDSAVLRQAVRYAQEKGVVIVASAGNDGYTDSTYPARYPGVISATATDANKQILSFSNASQNFGLSSPGLEVATYGTDGSPVTFSGTSASAPLVAASVAAVMANNPGITSAQAIALLQQYADDAGAAGPDADYGYGQINLDRINQRTQPNRTDAAVASHYYNSKATGGPTMDYVVENRGTTALINWTLNTVTNGVAQSWPLPIVRPNEETVISVPLGGTLATDEVFEFQSRLTAPQGTHDVIPQNNHRGTTLTIPGIPPTAAGK